MAPLIWVLCVFFFLVLLRRNHLLDMATATHPSNLELEAKLDALLNAELDDATGFACVPDTLVKELEQFTAAIPREWTPKPTSQDHRNGACCPKQLKANSTAFEPWQVITQTWDELSTWDGSFIYDGTALYTGRILSYKHSDIERIVNGIRRNHTESFLSPKTRVTLSPSLNYVRLVCGHGREEDLAEFRERKTRTQRADAEDDCCPVAINLVWGQVRPGVSAWRVSKLVTGHQSHIARVHKEVNLTQEQRQSFGAEMVDAHLTAAQVFTAHRWPRPFSYAPP
jgi:hypothetical protein